MLSTVSKVAICMTLACASRSAWSQVEPIPLYPAEHPANEGDNPAPPEPDRGIEKVTCDPAILPYLPEKPAASRAAVVICPGGGYGVLAMRHEGTAVAEWFAERGIAALICRYRCGGGKNLYPVPQQDAQRALRLVRSRASQWNIDPNKVGIMGFSAGGHLAVSVTTLGEPSDLDQADPIDSQSSVPNFCIDIYGVMSMLAGESHGGSRTNLLGDNPDLELCRKLTPPLQVSFETPPMFILHSQDDKAVPVAGAVALEAACIKHGVPVELHLLASGGHGYGIVNGTEGSYRQWPALLEGWLIDRQLMDQR